MPRTPICFVLVSLTLVGCGAQQPSLSELQAACSAGSAQACAQAERAEEINRIRIEREMSGDSPLKSGCQQGAEGEIVCL